jgi:hypothetical protein
MTPCATLSASKICFWWERLSASIVAAAKPLPQGNWGTGELVSLPLNPEPFRLFLES